VGGLAWQRDCARRLALLIVASSACGRFHYDEASAGDGGPGGDGGVVASLSACDPSDAVLVRAATLGGNSERPHLAIRGSSVAAVWTDVRSGVHQIYYRPVGAGAALGSEGNLTNSSDYSYYPTVRFDGTNLAMAWTTEIANGDFQVDFARFDASGSRVGEVSTLVTLTATAWWPVLTWNGSQYAVVWADDSVGGLYNVYAARLDASGSMLGSVGKLTNDVGNAWAPTMAFDGSGYGVVYEEGDGQAQQLFFQRLDGVGTPLGGRRQLTTGTVDSNEPSLAWNGTQYGLVWYTDTEEVRFLAIGPDGTPLGMEVVVATGAFYPALSWSGSSFATAWIDRRDGSPRTYAGLLDPDGSFLEPPVAVSAAGVEAAHPDIAWAGDRWAITWSSLGGGGDQEEIFVMPECQ